MLSLMLNRAASFFLNIPPLLFPLQQHYEKVRNLEEKKPAVDYYPICFLIECTTFSPL